MSKRISQICSVIAFLLLLAACRDPFEPEVTNTDLGILVVEGFIETNGEESTIILSRTAPIGQSEPFSRVARASIRLNSESGEAWFFSEKNTGEYGLSATLDNNVRYRLEINLSDGRQYLSEWMQPVVSPEIGEVGFIKDQNGVEIFVSTQGNEAAQYFLWTYEEHWIFRPGVRTVFKYNPDTKNVEPRKEDERIDLCWNSNLFPKLILQNAARFENNTILQRELVRIAPGDERLMQRYSILVKQRAIDQETYDFWEILRKNSDDIGGIFSPLPSLIRSNIVAISAPDERVIGFVSMGKSASKRLYINNSEVAPWVASIPEYEFCQVEADTVLVANYEAVFASGQTLPARPVLVVTTTIGFNPVTRACADCTLRGTNVRPAFWED
jgi:hypothetical protein